jgi:hypothetical protein
VILANEEFVIILFGSGVIAESVHFFIVILKLARHHPEMFSIA